MFVAHEAPLDSVCVLVAQPRPLCPLFQPSAASFLCIGCSTIGFLPPVKRTSFWRASPLVIISWECCCLQSQKGAYLLYVWFFQKVPAGWSVIIFYTLANRTFFLFLKARFQTKNVWFIRLSSDGHMLCQAVIKTTADEPSGGETLKGITILSPLIPSS